MNNLYVITGISGSGKTTIGKIIASKINNAVYINENNYYKDEPVKVRISDGSYVSNWDCLEVISNDFTRIIQNELQLHPVVLVGFALPISLLPVQAKVHIHLVTASTPSQLEERCIAARHNIRSYIDPIKDFLIVREVIIPFYHWTVRNSDISHLINVYDNKGKRIVMSHLVSIITKIILDANMPRITKHTMDVAEPYHTLIRLKKKPVEGRKISPAWNKIRRGDILTMTSPDNVPFETEVTGITMYLPSISPDPLTAYLIHETLERALPGVSSIEEGRRIYLQWSTEEEIRKMGMMGIQVRVL